MKKSTKDILLESAEDLIARNGYYETKVEDITNKAGVAKGTFYIYFPSKEEMFIAILNKRISALSDKIGLIREKSNNFEEKMFFATREYLIFLTDNLGIIGTFVSFEKEKKNSKFMKMLMELHNIKIETLTEFFRDAVEKKEVEFKYPDRIDAIARMYDICRTEYIFHSIMQVMIDEDENNICSLLKQKLEPQQIDTIKEKIDIDKEARFINETFLRGLVK